MVHVDRGSIERRLPARPVLQRPGRPLDRQVQARAGRRALPASPVDFREDRPRHVDRDRARVPDDEEVRQVTAQVRRILRAVRRGAERWDDRLIWPTVAECVEVLEIQEQQVDQARTGDVGLPPHLAHVVEVVTPQPDEVRFPGPRLQDVGAALVNRLVRRADDGGAGHQAHGQQEGDPPTPHNLAEWTRAIKMFSPAGGLR